MIRKLLACVSTLMRLPRKFVFFFLKREAQKLVFISVVMSLVEENE